MTSLLCGLLVGFWVGRAAGRWRCRRQSLDTCADPEKQDLTDEDRRQIEAEFQTHAAAVHRQVREIADALADDDQVLRARLRQFETGGEES